MASFLRRAERMRRRKPQQRDDGTFTVPPVCEDVADGKVADYFNDLVGSLRGSYAKSSFHAVEGSEAAERTEAYSKACSYGRARSPRRTGGRTGRFARGLTAKVGRGFLKGLAEVNLDHWYRAIFITIAPPPWLDQISFLRCADAFLRDYKTLRVKNGEPDEITEYPCERFRSMEAVGIDCQLAKATSRRQVMFHDHHLMIAWHSLRASDRRDWMRKVEEGLVNALERRFGSLPRSEGRVVSVHVEAVEDRQHFTHLVRGLNGAMPYMLKDIENDVSFPVHRNWTSHHNPPPELPESVAGADHAPTGVAVVEEERWTARLSGEQGLRLREMLFRWTGRSIPQLAANYVLYDVDQRDLVTFMELIGVDCSAIHRAWRPRPPT